jgi:hypothetical protein
MAEGESGPARRQQREAEEVHATVMGTTRAAPTCTCPRAPCGGSIVLAESPEQCPWHRGLPAETFHYAGKCPGPVSPWVLRYEAAVHKGGRLGRRLLRLMTGGARGRAVE